MRARCPCSPLLLLLVSVASLLSWPQVARAQLPDFDIGARYQIPAGDVPVRGPDDALVTIVEFSDFACQYCRRAQGELALLARLYPREIRLAFRFHPLDLEEGTLALEASLAAREEGLFWPMHDRIFAAGGVVSRAQLEAFAVELGLDMTRFREVLDSGEYRPYLARLSNENRELGVFSTPRFFVNGRPIKGAQSVRVFSQVVAEELARARAMTAAGVPASAVYPSLMKTARPRADSAPEASKHGQRDLDEFRDYQVGLGLPGHTQGPETALVTVVVFTDFQCPFCRKLLPTLHAMRATYPDDVRIAFRHLPLDFHPQAQLASEAAAAAAAQGRFWELHDQIFAHPKALTRADLDRYASELGLDMVRFARDLDERRYRGAVKADRARGAALGVRATPTMFINGTPVTGARPFEDVDALYLQPKLEEARAMVAAGVARADVYATIMARAEPEPAAAEDPGGDVAEARPGHGYQQLLLACSGRQAGVAAGHYERVTDSRARAEARVYCRAYGVDLAE